MISFAALSNKFEPCPKADGCVQISSMAGESEQPVLPSLSAGVPVPLVKSYLFFPLLEFFFLAVITGFFEIFAPSEAVDEIS